MTPANLRAWLDRRGLSQKKAAPLLGTSQQTVSRWVNGQVPIPKWAERIVALLDRIEALEQAASAAQPE